MFASTGIFVWTNSVGFFDGYDNIYAIVVVLLNSVIGVVITFLYKYGDAVIKCFANVLSSMILILISIFFLGLTATVTSTCGCIIVFSATYIYMILNKDFKPNSIPHIDTENPPSMKQQLMSNTV
jgi:hypothetical protein